WDYAISISSAPVDCGIDNLMAADSDSWEHPIRIRRSHSRGTAGSPPRHVHCSSGSQGEDGPRWRTQKTGGRRLRPFPERSSQVTGARLQPEQPLMTAVPE